MEVETKDRAWAIHERHNEPAPHESTAKAAVNLLPATQAKPKARRVSIWSAVRGFLAVTTGAFLVWWLVVPLFFAVTSRAVVNARTVQVRSPIDGTNVELSQEIGSEVAAGQFLLRVANPRVDGSHLAELDGRLSGLLAKKSRLLRDLQQGVAEAPILRATQKRYQGAVVDGLRSAVREAKARYESAHIEFKAAELRKKRLARLSHSSGGTAAEVDDLEETTNRARKNLEREQATLGRLEDELAAAQQGIFLQNEASYARKRADELDEKIAALRSELKEADEQLVAARYQVFEERQRLDDLKGASLAAPVCGTVWKRPGNPGQIVKQNEVVYEIAGRDSIFVEALVHQRYLGASVVAGAKAVVNLTSGQRLGGTVRAVRTLGEGGSEATYAIPLTCADARHVRVLIALDGCQDCSLIGRHARVLITSENPSWTERSVAWLFSCVGG